MIPAAVMRERVNCLESVLNHAPQVDCPVRHMFSEGRYIREIMLPAGTVITGAIHKTAHITYLSKGRIRLVTPAGVKEYVAPRIFASPPGVKNAVYAIEDTVWTSIHRTSTQDVNALVSELTESNADELIGGKKNAQRIINQAKETVWLSA